METFFKLCYFILVLVLSVRLVCNQGFRSPCPDVFSYERIGNRLYGKIVLRGRSPVSQLELQASFAVYGYVSNYGSIELADNPMFALQGYNRGLPLQYRVHFSDSSQIPILTEIAVNGKIICSGPKLIPQPNQIVTNFNLKQTSYLQRTAADFGVVQPQGGQYDLFTSILNENQGGTQQVGDETLINALNNIWSNQAVQETPTSRPIRPRPILGTVTPQREVETIISYIPRDESTLPPEPLTTQRSTTVRITLRQPEAESQIECGTRTIENDRLALVYNGKDYLRGDLPWLVAIYRQRGSNLGFICGGTLVSDRHVVTAAHCMRHGNDQSKIREIVVKVGVHKLDDWDDDISVTRSLSGAAIHESFNATTLQNDILVLTFTKPVKFNAYIRPACLWSGDTDLDQIVGTSGTVAGWGTRQNQGAGIGEPQLVSVPIVKTDECRLSNIAFFKITSDKSFCAGDRNGSGPCTGDSGGGFYIYDGTRWRLRGVVSFSLRAPDGSCDLSDYVVFTDVAKYLPWIQQVLAGQGNS